MATTPQTASKPKEATAKPTPAVVPEPVWEPKGAAAKLAYIQAHIDYVPKTGTNTHQNFDYFEEHGILALLRPFQRQLRVSIITTFLETRHEGNMTSGICRVTLIDTELPAYAEGEPGEGRDRAIWAEFPCQATDNQGWGAAKMLTYGKKFGLQKFFAIPAEELPEAEREAIAAATGAERPIGVSDAATVAELRRALIDGQADATRVKAKLTASFKASTIEDLLPSQVADFKAWVLEETAKLAPEAAAA